MRKKSLIRRLIPWIILLVIIGGLVYLGFLLYGKKPAAHDRGPTIAYYDGKSPKLKMENEYPVYRDRERKRPCMVFQSHGC